MNDTFEQLYSTWPTQRDKAATRAAWEYVYKKCSYSDTEYLEAQELWLSKATDWQRQHLSLGQWLRDELFIEPIKSIKAAGGLKNALEHVQMTRDLTMVVLGEWNRLRRHWWTTVDNIEQRYHVVEAALSNNYWAKEWQRALEIARNVLEYPQRDSIGNVKLTPTIEWLCDLEHGTVNKLIEGYYGQPTRPRPLVSCQRPKLSPEDQVEIGSMFANFKQEQGAPPSTAWKVRVSFTTIALMFQQRAIETHPLPNTNEDQAALRDTLQAQADLFNKQHYSPSLESPATTDTVDPMEQLGLLDDD